MTQDHQIGISNDKIFVYLIKNQIIYFACRIIESQGVIEKRSSLLEMSHSDSFICPSAVPCIDDSFIDNAISPERLVN